MEKIFVQALKTVLRQQQIYHSVLHHLADVAAQKTILPNKENWQSMLFSIYQNYQTNVSSIGLTNKLISAPTRPLALSLYYYISIE